MIQINSNLCTEVNVDFDMSGNEIPATLRLYFLCSTTDGDFFVGFDGTDKRIDVPPLNNITFPNNIRAKLEVILGNYNIKIWEDDIQIIQSKEFITEGSINRIKIKVHLKEQETQDPKISVKHIKRATK